MILLGSALSNAGEVEPGALDRVLDFAAPRARIAMVLLSLLGVAAARSRHERAARFVLERLGDHDIPTNGGLFGPICIARLKGDLWSVLGDREEARRHYEKAFEVCDQMRLRPEKALTALGMAELLLDGNAAEQAEAQRHLDFAIAELREMKMQPWLERALKHKGLLKA
jgi:tetratricopeptide (TPR) repeat protein